MAQTSFRNRSEDDVQVIVDDVQHGRLARRTIIIIRPELCAIVHVGQSLQTYACDATTRPRVSL